LLAASTAPLLAQTAIERDAAGALAAVEQAVVDLIARTEPSVVAISRAAPRPAEPNAPALGDVFGELRRNSRADSAAIVGAGVIIDGDGLVLTQYLAVRQGDQHVVTTIDGKRYSATIRGADPRSGLAVLAIEPAASPLQRAGDRAKATPGSFRPLPLGDATTLRKGNFVVAFGNPYSIVSDAQPTASWGIITNLARKAPSGTNFNDAPGPFNDHRTSLHHLGTLIQTDARLGWNAGGGALVNLRGELVGLTTTAATIAGHEQPAGYAIPINALMRRIIDTLLDGREVEYGMLGVAFGQFVVEAGGARSRLRIAQVYPGGPAARGGLRAGDVIQRVGDQPVDDVDAVQLAISALPPAATTTIVYQRDGRPATATVTLAKLAVAGKTIASVEPSPWHGMRVDYATTLDAAQFAQAIASGAYDPAGCVLITAVEPQSEAWRAGVRPGMFVSHVGRQRVSAPEEFRAAAGKVPNDAFDIRLTQPLPPNENSSANE
jgi:S1-C subfamily serine protease